MREARTCSKCGTRLAGEGPCPKCLMGLGFEKLDRDRSLDGPVVALNSGDRIGRYKLLEQIGEGGCGVVYVAQQEEPVRRQVALKVIKLGMDTRQVVARFEAERQALALMDHPYIAKVLDGGTTATGRPFFVMELLRGAKVTEYCDQNRLSTEARLRLFIQICGAIQHAHQKGVIHRDIKPSNILVAAQEMGAPLLKVIDFGIAKAATDQRLTDETIYTAFEQFLGTPAYMSPEQAGLGGLDVDTRSDIYSLGVLLYELLTGQTPFDLGELRRAAMDQVLRAIRETEPPTPSARLTTLSRGEQIEVARCRQIDPARLSGLLRGDLDWIVMKALEKDRSRRYETANGLALDVARYLKNEPVLARPPSRLYRFRKSVRRNKLAFGAAGAVGVALLAGAILSAWLAVRASRASERANQQTRLARSVVDFLQTDLLRQADGRGQADLGYQPKLDLTLREGLDRAAARVGSRFRDEPLVEASILATVGETYVSIDEVAKAIPLLERAVLLRRNRLGENDPDTLAGMSALAVAYREAWQLERATRLFEEILQRQEAVLGERHPDTLRTMYNLAMAYRNAVRYKDAIDLHSRALKLRRAVLGPDHPDTLHSVSGLAIAYSDSGRVSEATPLFEESLRMRTARLGPLHPDTLWSMNGVATMYVRAGKTSEAVRLYESALSRMKTEQGYMHRETDMVLNNLASAYQDQGRAFEAAALYEDALRTARAVQTNNPSRYLRWLARRCELLVASNTTNAAAGALEEFDRLSDPLSREASSDQQVQVLRLRGRLRARCGRLAEAAADLSKVVALDPKGHWDWFQLAPLLLESGDTAGYRKHCVGMLARFGTETDLILAERTAKVCLLMQPETSVASEVYALADRIAGVNPEHSAYGFFQIAKALADYRRGQFVGAVDSAGRALAKPRSAYRDIQGYAITAMATFQLHRDEEARVALAKAVEIAEQNLPEENSQNLGDSWQDALMCRSILREARNLIERTAKPVGSAP